jgi:elongation factor G
MSDALTRSFYRETVEDSAVADGKIIRQRGAIGVYAHVRVEIRALNRGQGTMLVWNAGLNFPTKFVSAVLQGIDDAMNAGVLAGLEMTDVCASVEDGSYHEEDSTVEAFREAARTAATEAIQHARPIMLEALSLVAVTVPLNSSEAVDAAVGSHGGKTRATTSESQSRTLSASLPTSNLSKLIVQLLSITDGCASISSRSDGFRPIPEPPDPLGSWVAIT